MKFRHWYYEQDGDRDRDGRAVGVTQADRELYEDDPNGWVTPSSWCDPDKREYD